MPRSFRSLLVHADELLADPGERVAKLDVRPASESEPRDRPPTTQAMLNQHLFESSQGDQNER